jgi:hypothetical protein
MTVHRAASRPTEYRTLQEAAERYHVSVMTLDAASAPAPSPPSTAGHGSSASRTQRCSLRCRTPRGGRRDHHSCLRNPGAHVWGIQRLTFEGYKRSRLGT